MQRTVAGNGAFAGVVIIAVDTHKRLTAVEALDERGAVLARQVFEHSTAGFKEPTSPSRHARLSCPATAPLGRRVGCLGVSRRNDIAVGQRFVVHVLGGFAGRVREQVLND